MVVACVEVLPHHLPAWTTKTPSKKKTSPGSSHEAKTSRIAHRSANFLRTILDRSNENCPIAKLKALSECLNRIILPRRLKNCKSKTQVAVQVQEVVQVKANVRLKVMGMIH